MVIGYHTPIKHLPKTRHTCCACHALCLQMAQQQCQRALQHLGRENTGLAEMVQALQLKAGTRATMRSAAVQTTGLSAEEH